MFLVFEGVDGAGKTTLIGALGQRLDQLGVKSVQTREPGGSELGEKIRQLLLSTDGESPIPRAEVLLYEAGRAQHVEKKIRPCLAQGIWVLCDRFTASSLAFQAGGRGMHDQQVQWLNDYAVAGCQPDLTVLIDIGIEESLRRKTNQKASGELDRFELEEFEFHQRVRDHYLKQASNQNNWLILDGMKSTSTQLNDLIAELQRRKWLKI